MHSLCTVELGVTVNNVKMWTLYKNDFTASLSPAIMRRRSY